MKLGRRADIPSRERRVGVLGDLLVGLLGGGRAGLLDSFGDVVGGVLDGLHYERVVGRFGFVELEVVL